MKISLFNAQDKYKYFKMLKKEKECVAEKEVGRQYLLLM